MKWNTTTQEQCYIQYIAARVRRLSGAPVALSAVVMGLEACHCNGCRLDLVRMAKASDADLMHDIHKYLDRETGELTDGFRPRLSARQ